MKPKHFVALCLATALVCSCNSSGNQAGMAPVQVSPYTIEESTCVIEYNYPATLQGVLDVAIYPQVSGRITKINVVQGQHVEKGDVLFEIDDVPYKAAYEEALAQKEVSLAQLAAANLTLESKQRLFDSNVISEYQLKIAKIDKMTAEASLAKADAAVVDARNSLGFTKVRTMSSGYAGPVPYKVGSLVNSMIVDPMTTISDNSSVYADFSIPENNYLLMANGNDMTNSSERIKNIPPLSLIMNNGVRYSEQGRVYAISGIISSATGALPVRAIFPNENKQLLSGGSCKVVFAFEQKNTLTVPRSSIKEIQNKMFVFKIDGDHVKQIEVNAERYNESSWILLPDENGGYPLAVGDKITSTTNRLKDNDMVTLKQ